MIISQIELLNWKNFKKANVSLAERVFIVGSNASGKSNFLDALRFVRELAILGGGLQSAVANRGGIEHIRCLAAPQDSDVGISLNIAHGEQTWRYEIRFAQEEYAVLTREAVYKDGKLILERPDKQDQEDELRLSQTALEQINFNHQFREIYQFLAQISYLHLVPQLIRGGGYFDQLHPLAHAYGQDFVKRIAAAHPKTREARLRRMQKALSVAVPQLKNLSLEKDKQGIPHLVGIESHWQAGSKQNERHFSDGTLRLLGLLWALQDGSGPLLLEEPELSLHSSIVRQLPSLLYRTQSEATRQRQLFISTHSFELLSEAGIGADEVLLLFPSTNGTQVKRANEVNEIRWMFEAGMSAAEAVIPHTEPKQIINH